jgi:hypothetical protein
MLNTLVVKKEEYKPGATGRVFLIPLPRFLKTTYSQI